MTPQELELLTRRTAALVLKGERYEDSIIELKREYPDEHRIARHVAGHGNAARGADIVWIIGLDEGKNGDPGSLHPLDDRDFDAYWRSVEKNFREAVPHLYLNRLVQIEGPSGPVSVRALVFHTAEGPYVVSNPKHGTVKGESISLEVPWRRGHNSVETARRRDLLEILVPRIRVPRCEVIDGKFEIFNQARTPEAVGAALTLRVYLTPYESGVWLISHRISGEVRVPNLTTISLEGVRLDAPHLIEHKEGARRSFVGESRKRSLSVSVEVGPDEAQVNGPGMVSLVRHFQASPREEAALRQETEMEITLSIPVAHAEVALSLEARLRRSSPSSTFLPVADAFPST